MKWSDISDICNKNTSSPYLTTLNEASDDLKESIDGERIENRICPVKESVFNLEKWKDDSNIESHVVDCMYVKCDENDKLQKVILIEFKGGKTIKDWVEIKDGIAYPTMRLKILDSVHCVLSKLLDEDNWIYSLSEACDFEYVICINSTHSIITDNNVSKNKIHSRVKSRSYMSPKKSKELGVLKSRLKKYSNNTPFSKIVISEASQFSINNPKGFMYSMNCDIQSSTLDAVRNDH
jgi:hypothetical protein